MAKRFLTPDTYFMERPDKIEKSPIEGALYSYVGNDPINFSDPTGKFLMNLTFHAFFTAPAASGGEFGLYASPTLTCVEQNDGGPCQQTVTGIKIGAYTSKNGGFYVDSQANADGSQSVGAGIVSPGSGFDLEAFAFSENGGRPIGLSGSGGVLDFYSGRLGRPPGYGVPNASLQLASGETYRPVLDPVDVFIPFVTLGRMILMGYRGILARHAAHHQFGNGYRKHLQLNVYREGVKNSGETIFRIPFGPPSPVRLNRP